MAKRGLVIGKFYPPHRGHHYLIETAQAQVEALVVLVCEKPEQPIPGALRPAWLREVHPSVDVQVVPDILEDDDSAAGPITHAAGWVIRLMWSLPPRITATTMPITLAASMCRWTASASISLSE